MTDDFISEANNKIFNNVLVKALSMLNNHFSLLSVLFQLLVIRGIKIDYKTDISLIFLCTQTSTYSLS